ncbi:TPA: hypothetical protein N0F65_007673, partial [Lagenidium giganteum]
MPTSAGAVRLVIVGGIEYESAQPVVTAPVLVYHVASNTFALPRDTILSSAAMAATKKPTLANDFVSPASRSDHASFQYQRTLFLFGGQRQGSLNDAWRLCLDDASSTATWDQLMPSTTDSSLQALPGPRIGHSLTHVYDNGSAISAFVFGGLSDSYVDYAGVHMLVVSKASLGCNDRSPSVAWRSLALAPQSPVPSARSYHVAARLSSIASLSTSISCLLVYGGKNTQQNVILGDLWRLCAQPGAVGLPIEKQLYVWEQLTPIGSTPGARYGAAATFIDDGKVALTGGSYTFPNDFLADSWELNVNATQWVRLHFSSDLSPPRRGHSATYVQSLGAWYVFGGKDRYAVVQNRIETSPYVAPYCATGLKITWCDATGTYVCVPCAAGTYLLSGSRTCALCPAGAFSAQGAAVCTPCPAGTYSTEVGKTNALPCTACPSGTFSTNVGATAATTCSACPAGSFSGAAGATSCTSCVAGTYSLSNSSSCQQCDIGKWSAAGASACSGCDAGTYNPRRGASTCLSCPKGFYTNGTASACSPCPAMSYGDNVRAAYSGCKPCPTATFTTSVGQPKCQTCPDGFTYASKIGCLPCAIGTYASAVATAGACVACPLAAVANVTTSAGVLYFPTTQRRWIMTNETTVSLLVARSNGWNGNVQAVIAWTAGNTTLGAGTTTPIAVALANQQTTAVISIPIANFSSLSGCRTATFTLQDVPNAAVSGGMSSVSTDPDQVITIFFDDMSGGTVGGVNPAVQYTTTMTVTLSRSVATSVTATPASSVVKSLASQPLLVLFVVDMASTIASTFLNSVPAVIAQLQTIYTSPSLSFGLLSPSQAAPIGPTTDVAVLLTAIKALAASTTPVDWAFLSSSLPSNQLIWTVLAPETRKFVVVVSNNEKGTLSSTADPNKMMLFLQSVRAQSAFTFFLSSTTKPMVAPPTALMQGVIFSKPEDIAPVLVSAFQTFDATVPKEVHVLDDPRGLVQRAQASGFSAGTSSLPVLQFQFAALGAIASSTTARIGVPGVIQLSLTIIAPGPSCSPPPDAWQVDQHAWSGWLDNVETLDDVQRAWQSDSAAVRVSRRTDYSLMRTRNSSILTVPVALPAGSALSFALTRRLTGSLFASGVPLVLRGFHRVVTTPKITATCSMMLKVTSVASSLAVGSSSSNLSSTTINATVTFANNTAGEWSFQWLSVTTPWELDHADVVLTCQMSADPSAAAASVSVEWTQLGLFPDPAFACHCPRGFYNDLDIGGIGAADASSSTIDGACVRCAAGSFCVAGIKRQCPDGTFSFGKADHCEQCRDGWICIA